MSLIVSSMLVLHLQSPVWNQRFAMPLPVGIDVVYVEIVDECMLQSDQMIGWACVPIPEELLVAGGDMPRKSYPLSGKQGPNQEGTVDGELLVLKSW